MWLVSLDDGLEGWFTAHFYEATPGASKVTLSFLFQFIHSLKTKTRFNNSHSLTRKCIICLSSNYRLAILSWKKRFFFVLNNLIFAITASCREYLVSVSCLILELPVEHKENSNRFPEDDCQEGEDAEHKQFGEADSFLQRAFLSVWTMEVFFFFMLEGYLRKTKLQAN